MKRYRLLPLLLLSVAAMAQTPIERDVVVESVYNPTVGTSVKRFFLPGEADNDATPLPIVYATTVNRLRSFTVEPLSAEGLELEKTKPYPGYFRMGFGTGSNVDGTAAYRLQAGEKNAFDAGVTFNGWNRMLALPGDDGNAYQSSRADLDSHLDFIRTESEHSQLRAGIDYGRYSFNAPLLEGHPLPVGTVAPQVANLIGGRVQWNGQEGNYSDNPLDLGFNLGYHRWNLTEGHPFGEHNTHGDLDVSIGLNFEDLGYLDVAIDNDLLLYGRHNELYSKPYYSFGLNPRWYYGNAMWTVVLGLHADAQSEGTPKVQVSPDCRISMQPVDRLKLTLITAGGRNLNDFRTLYTAFPLWDADGALRNAYTHLDSRLQGDLRIVDGLLVSLWGGYRMVTDALFATCDVASHMLSATLCNEDATAKAFGLQASWTYKDIVRVGLDAHHDIWKVSDTSLLQFVPKTYAELNGRVRIIKGLHADTGFRFATFGDGTGSPMLDLCVGADYVLNDRVSLFLNGQNLLNRHWYDAPALPTQGIRGRLGATVKL